MYRIVLRILFFACISFAVLPVSSVEAKTQVPIRWCGMHGAPSIDNPAGLGEASIDDVLWRRHERPTDKIYKPFDITFRSAATKEIKDGPLSFPVIYDTIGSGGDVQGSSQSEVSKTVNECEQAWHVGDPIYFDLNTNGIVDDDIDSYLNRSTNVLIGYTRRGHDGISLSAMPNDVGYVDSDDDAQYDICDIGFCQFDTGDAERIYRDENNDGFVDAGDTLLVATSGTIVGNTHPDDIGEPLEPMPASIGYLDLIHEPANTYNIGYPAINGIIAVSVDDLEYSSIAFPVHGVATGIGSCEIVVDDPGQYLPPGPNYRLFETQLVGHEFGHALSLRHGDGIDDDNNGELDDADDPAAPFPGAGPGTECSSNNMMSYCWQDEGNSGDPDLLWVGVGIPQYSIMTMAQADKIVDFSEECGGMEEGNGGAITAFAKTHFGVPDPLGELDAPFEHLDIAKLKFRLLDNDDYQFELSWGQSFPATATETVDVYFQLDLDGLRTTGGTDLDRLTELSGISTFIGAELMIPVELSGNAISLADGVYIHNGSGWTFVQNSPAAPDVLIGSIKTILSEPNFPFGDTSPGVLTVPYREQLTVEVLLSGLSSFSLPALAERFRFEATVRTAVVGQSDVVDDVRVDAASFDVPTYPECSAAPEQVLLGETTTISARDLLENASVHFLLGDEEVATGQTDAQGDTATSFQIPTSAQTGKRLITVGSAAVTADCGIEVFRRNGVLPALIASEGTGVDENPPDGTFDSISVSEEQAIHNSSTSELRSIFEFDLSVFPENALINSAILTVEFTVEGITGPLPSTRTIEVHGYAGDGIVQVTDAEQNGLLASFSLDTAQEDESADLTNFVRALLAGDNDFLGVNMREISSGNAELIKIVGAPQLQVDYFVPADVPSMSHWHLLLLAGCLVFASSVALSNRPRPAWLPRIDRSPTVRS